MQLIIDRFEGKIAVVADAQKDEVYYDLPRLLLGKAKEGDLVNVQPGSGFEVLSVGETGVTLATAEGPQTIPIACSCGVRAGEKLSFQVDPQATAVRRERINSLINALFED